MTSAPPAPPGPAAPHAAPALPAAAPAPAAGPSSSQLGILNPQAAAQAFRLSRLEPSPELAPYVERYWCVRWDLPEGEVFTQETLSHPAINLVFEAHRAAIHGVNTRRFSIDLRARGQAVGVKFRPGGFAAFWPGSIHKLCDRAVPYAELAGATAAGGAAFARELLACDDAAAKARLDAQLLLHLLPAEPRRDEEIAAAVRIVQLALTREITTVAALARRGRLSVRALQRLFRRYVGVGPKWVLRRLRLHQAAERVALGQVSNWADFAVELGYADQAHFSREFREYVGRAPAEYAAWCAASMAKLMRRPPAPAARAAPLP